MHMLIILLLNTSAFGRVFDVLIAAIVVPNTPLNHSVLPICGPEDETEEVLLLVMVVVEFSMSTSFGADDLVF